ncbi:low temperature requirement protein A [Acinetobacter sp.]|uniref:low temperature requirement protein A n=1 Tax=Acinetobacter sp. TaxID=472 RepID=UPI0028B0FAF0|nr:low temperature requirement protein A [Acinetobacter sp.]
MSTFFLKSLKPMQPRDVTEQHRVATSLELLFDLIFVVAIASAGQQLHHAIIKNHLMQSLPLYCMVFFALWWSWMNFTWFASAYDNDDTLYRLMTMVQMLGALVIAAGIPLAFQKADFDIIILGYVIMRTVLILQWLRAAKHDPERRSTIYRYVIGITIIQVGWLFFHFSPIDFTVHFFVALALAEMSIPFTAEKYGKTPWHPHHIAERYSLLTIIVLGESIVASFKAVSDAFKHQVINTELIFMTVGGVMMMFTMWWMYFDRAIHGRLNNHRRVFFWGYGHFFIFIAIASVGAALAAAVDVAASHTEISHQYTGFIVAMTLIVYSFSLWLLHDLPFLTGLGKWFYPLTALVIFVIPFLIQPIGYCVFMMALVYGLRLVFSKWLFKSEQSEIENSAVQDMH